MFSEVSDEGLQQDAWRGPSSGCNMHGRTPENLTAAVFHLPGVHLSCIGRPSYKHSVQPYRWWYCWAPLKARTRPAGSLIWAWLLFGIFRRYGPYSTCFPVVRRTPE